MARLEYMDVSKIIQRQWWVQGLRDTKRDLKSIRWRRIGHVTGIFIWFSGMIVCLVLIDLSIIFRLSNSVREDCGPDGSFPKLDMDWTYNPWTPSGFLDINVKFGSLTFAAAKAIDIAWDVIFGRVGQLMLAFLTCHTFKRYAMASMSVKPLTYKTFWLIFTQNEPGAMSVIELCREFYSRQCLKSKGAMAYILVSSIYIIIFPTFASAMTGYTAVGQPFVDVDGALLALGSFKQSYGVAFVIHDGDRIQLEKDYVIKTPFRTDIEEEIYNLTRQYLEQFGASGKNMAPSLWGDQHLPAPTLDISNYPKLQYDSREYYTSSVYRSSRSNRVLDESDMRANGICKPAENFQWGFSFLQLNLMFISLMIWTVGTYIIWLNAHLTRIEHGEIPEYLKCALHLSSAIRHELGDSCSNPEELTNKDLKNLLKIEAKGGHVRLSELNSPDMYNLRRGLLSCVKKHKWVSILTLVMIFFLLAPYIDILSQLGGHYSGPLPGPPAAIRAFSTLAGVFILTFTPIIGRSTWSRVFLMTCVVLVASFITVVWAIHNHNIRY